MSEDIEAFKRTLRRIAVDAGNGMYYKLNYTFSWIKKLETEVQKNKIFLPIVYNIQNSIRITKWMEKILVVYEDINR